VTAHSATDDTRRTLRTRLRFLRMAGSENLRTRRLRALLEEIGVHCDDTAELHDLDAVVLSSARGTEALVAARLDDLQRLVAYGRVVARLLVDEMRLPLDAKLEYADGASALTRREREDERMVIALAEAIAEGRLEAAPRPLYEDVPKLTLAFTPRSAARSTLGGFHWWSATWYRRSNMYRRWRSRRDVSTAIGRICGALGRASLPAA
jgi:hypothetical protein